MKFNAELDGEICQVTFSQNNDHIAADIDGRKYEVTVHRPERDVLVIVSEGIVNDCRIERNLNEPNTVVVNNGSEVFEITVVDPKRLRVGAASKTGEAGGKAQIIAPMPGKVVRIIAKPGTRVDAGDGIVVVEAMKMQNELKSPRAGTLVEIRVAVADTVNAGDVLAVVE